METKKKGNFQVFAECSEEVAETETKGEAKLKTKHLHHPVKNTLSHTKQG